MPNVTIANTTLRVVLDERGTPGDTDVPTFVVGGVSTCGQAETRALDDAFDEWRRANQASNKARKWDPSLFIGFAEILIAQKARPFSVTFASTPSNISVLKSHVADLVPARLAAGRPPEPELATSVRNWLWGHFVASSLAINLFSLALSYRRVRAVDIAVGRYSLSTWERNLLERSLRGITGNELNRHVPEALERRGFPTPIVSAWRQRVGRAAAWAQPSVRTEVSGKRIAMADAYCALVGRSCDGDLQAAAALRRLVQAFERIDGKDPLYLMNDLTLDILRVARLGWPKHI